MGGRPGNASGGGTGLCARVCALTQTLTARASCAVWPRIRLGQALSSTLLAAYPALALPAVLRSTQRRACAARPVYAAPLVSAARLAYAAPLVSAVPPACSSR